MTFDSILPGDRFYSLAQADVILIAVVAAAVLLNIRRFDQTNGRFALVTLSPLLAAYLILSVVFLIEVADFISIPVAVNYNEGGLMSHVVEALDGGMYSEVGKPPYEINNYGPVFFYLTAAITRLFGIEILAAIRVISTIATLGCAILAGAMTFLALPSRFPRPVRMMAAAFAGLIFVTSTMALRAIGRLDSLAILFSLVGMLSLIISAGRPAWLAVAVLAFIAAGFTKQTAVAGLMASTVVLFYVAPRSAIKFALCVIVMTAAIFAGLQIVTSGNFFMHTVWANASQPFDLLRWLSKDQQFLFSRALGVGLAVFGCVMSFASAPAGCSPEAALKRLIPMAYGAFAMLGTITAGKAGAAINHFLEPNLALSVLTAIGIGYSADYVARNWVELRPKHKIAGLAVLALVTFQAWTMLGKHSNNPVTKFLHQARDQIASAAEVVRRVRNAEGPIIAEDRSFLVLAKKPVFYELNDMRLLAKAGKFSEEPVLDCLRNGPCELVVLEKRTHHLVQSIVPGEASVRSDRITLPIASALATRMSANMASVIATRFRLVWSDSETFVYAPKPIVEAQ